MVIISKYMYNYSRRIPEVISLEADHQCPMCLEGILKYRDKRLRRFKDASSNTQEFIIHRLKCPICHSYHEELPDCLEPYKQYTREVIQTAISDKNSYCPAENSTIQRWKGQYQKTSK